MSRGLLIPYELIESQYTQRGGSRKARRGSNQAHVRLDTSILWLCLSVVVICIDNGQV